MGLQGICGLFWMENQKSCPAVSRGERMFMDAGMVWYAAVVAKSLQIGGDDYEKNTVCDGGYGLRYAV